MAESQVELDKVLKEDLYCECGTWVYTPQMNQKVKDEQGEEAEAIGEGCLMADETGDYLQCPECKHKFYIVG